MLVRGACIVLGFSVLVGVADKVLGFSVLLHGKGGVILGIHYIII